MPHDDAVLRDGRAHSDRRKAEERVLLARLRETFVGAFRCLPQMARDQGYNDTQIEAETRARGINIDVESAGPEIQPVGSLQGELGTDESTVELTDENEDLSRIYLPGKSGGCERSDPYHRCGILGKRGSPRRLGQRPGPGLNFGGRVSLVQAGLQGEVQGVRGIQTLVIPNGGNRSES